MALQVVVWNWDDFLGSFLLLTANVAVNYWCSRGL